MSELIHRQLPYLRRFARALLGRQGVGDRLVAQAIDRLGTRLATLDDAFRLRLLLLQAMVDVIGERAFPSGANNVAGDGEGRRESVTIANERIIASRVRSLPEDGAIALLLATLEGLSVEDIAFVTRLDPASALARLRAAQDVLDAQEPCAVLIIEDEPVIAMDIAGIVRQAGHVVLGIATTHKEAVAMVATKRPGLILADIALADDSSGIKAVHEIRGQGPVPVVFITAYPERLLEDERVEPSLLISKPFSEHLLRVAIAQALDLDGSAAERHAGAAD